MAYVRAYIAAHMFRLFAYGSELACVLLLQSKLRTAFPRGGFRPRSPRRPLSATQYQYFGHFL